MICGHVSDIMALMVVHDLIGMYMKGQALQLQIREHKINFVGVEVTNVNLQHYTPLLQNPEVVRALR